MVNWKWYWLSSLFIGLPIAWIWIQHFYITSQPTYVDGAAGAGLGMAIMIMTTFSFLAGMFTRYIIWVLAIFLQQRNKRVSNRKNITKSCSGKFWS
jgi:hypothetical protein